jgi:hypothetical protein
VGSRGDKPSRTVMSVADRAHGANSEAPVRVSSALPVAVIMGAQSDGGSLIVRLLSHQVSSKDLTSANAS